MMNLKAKTALAPMALFLALGLAACGEDEGGDEQSKIEASEEENHEIATPEPDADQSESEKSDTDSRRLTIPPPTH